MVRTARTALQRLAELPAGPAVLAAARRFGGLWLVGGAVRDALLDAPVRDLDLAVEGDVAPVVAALGAPVGVHERFGTAEVAVPPHGALVNLARTRAETYARPGALPDVRPAGIDADLHRRDFTVNAVAVGLSEDVRGEVRAVPHALEDLDARLLRVLHERSFVDDPTRALRLARYVARLGLGVEERTEALARAARLDAVSGDRVGRELRALLAERDPVGALCAAARLGLLAELAPDPALAEAGLALLPADGRADLLVLASGAVRRGPETLAARLRALGFTADEVGRAARAAEAPRLARALAAAERPSAIAAAARGWPPEAVALAGALGPAEPVRAWLERLRHVGLEIGGRDLLAAGVPQGPEVGRRLARALDLRLDGALAAGREAELAAALAG